MPRLIRVSFDYDDTLSEEEVARYAASLRERGFDCWIVTARPPDMLSDVRKDAKKLGFNLEHIVAVGGYPKWIYLKEIAPVWHLDDDMVELAMINAQRATNGIRFGLNPDWMDQCNELLAGHMTRSGFAKRDISERGLARRYKPR
jgi:hydroxymethylpyrimidine pyrophosphatase-like HAD family hydrolase